MKVANSLLFLAALGLAIPLPSVFGQLVIEATTTTTGVVESIGKGKISVKDADGKTLNVLVQPPGEPGVTLSDGIRLRFDGTALVSGSLPLSELATGQIIKFNGLVNRLGRTKDKPENVELITGKDARAGITVKEAGASPAAFSKCEVIARITKLTKTRLILAVPASELTKKTALAFDYDPQAIATLKSDDYTKAAAGAKVTKLEYVRLNTGDLIAKRLEVEISSETKAKDDLDDKLLAKYRNLSDEPRKPRRIASQHFRFVSDLSDREAQIILDKLETMATLLTKYFGRGPTSPVEGFIVRDLEGWPDGILEEPLGVQKIANKEGVCFNSSLGNARRAVLYSCDDHGVIQHECTHGFCHLAFGSTGPTWLSEGVAELGNYWKADNTEVDVSPIVISYLQQADPKRKLLDIAVPGRTDSGTWRDYAWRWALCHLLAYNPNYASRFKPLAIALMQKQENVSFEAVYGPVADQISFEYDLFLQQLDNGYRNDLTAWQWNVKAIKLSEKRTVKTKVKAAYGWQATQIILEEGVSYDVAGVGDWKVSAGGKGANADGVDDGRGKLVGVVFKDFKLSDPIEFGKRHTFEPTTDGQLFLRCSDKWNEIGDNDGEITVHVRRTPE